MIEMETAGKEEEERAEKKRKKKFDDEVKVGKAKTEQKLKHEKKTDEKRDQTNQRTNQREVKRRPCVHYDQPNHLSTNCDNVTSVSERRKRLIQKQLCFSWTGPNHRAEECHCVTKCSHCRRRRHSSISENISVWIQKTWAHVSCHWEKQCNLPGGCRWSLWYSVPCATGHWSRKLIRVSSLTWSNR